MITVGIINSRATSTATKPPPPPNERSAKSEGVWPNSTVMALTAPTIFVTEIRITPLATSSTLNFNRSALFCSDFLASDSSKTKVPASAAAPPR